MKISEKELRQLVREALFNEGPFDEFMTSSGPSIPPVWKQKPDYKKSQRSSIAHPSKRGKDKLYKGEKYTDIVKDLMSSTQDNWVIITPDDVWDYNHFKPGELEEWLRNKKKPAGTIFAYAAGIPMRGDERSPQWAVVHDLIGHTLERVWQYGGGRRPEKIPESEIAAVLHKALPSKYQISNNPADILPDVFAAILLGALTPGLAREVVGEQFLNSRTDEEIADAQERVDAMFSDVDSWLEKARADGFVMLAPW